MEIKIDFTKSAQDNAGDYFKLSKKLKKKSEGAALAIKDLEKKISKIRERKPEAKIVRQISEKKWYEKFNWFLTSNGMLAIGGRSALQNELVNSKYFDSGDLFFHADVFGASAVVLKNGSTGASLQVREEVAQFAGCFSRSWDSGAASVNVYALGREQVSKSKEKGSLGTGSFLLEGEREWFKGVALELCAYSDDAKPPGISIVPLLTAMAEGIKGYILIKPGIKKKSDAAKELSERLKFHDIDYIMQHLPSGGFSIK